MSDTTPETQPIPPVKMFVADLHHPGGRHAEIEKLFDAIPESVTEIFLLGDIFHYWINDPDLIENRYGPFLQRLRKLAADGKDIFFIEGNRDFLASAYFENEPWIHVIENPTVIDVGGRVAYIGHGDELCWNDYQYQFYKRIVRSALVRYLADRMPNAWKRKIARRMSAASGGLVAAKSGRTLRVPARAYRYMVAMGMDLIIHGHVHDSYQQAYEASGRAGAAIAFGWKDGKRNVIML